ncbi:MAG: dehydrogenase E1 component subunit alpha/beta [Chitinophagaceae bacterium]
MHFDRKDLYDDQLRNMYRSLLLPRLIEEKMLLLLRQGKVSKWFSGIGQEAISVGATLALQPDEWIMPLHRNLGVFTSRGLPLGKLFLQWQGNSEGYSKGRERSFHFGSSEHFICGMISHLGPQLTVACGTALARLLNNKPGVSLAFTGEGGTSEGDFHEALNLASVWDLPVIFIIENNGYALSSPVSEQYRCESLVDRAKGYGMEGVRIDGNNLLEVFDTVKGVREYCINNQRPYLIECMTFRIRGHEEASGVKYVPPELIESWKENDPVSNYETFLSSAGIFSREDMTAVKIELKEWIDGEINDCLDRPSQFGNAAEEIRDVYASAMNYETEQTRDFDDPDPNPAVKAESDADTAEPVVPAGSGSGEPSSVTKHAMTTMRFVDAISQAIDQSMEKHPSLVLMGQDIAGYGGAFKVTEGLLQKYGKKRVRNTPLCESAVIGTAMGLSLEGRKSMVEMQFADFVTAGFNQIVNNLAKLHYRWGKAADVVIRMPAGAGVGAGPFHSQSNEAWFVHTPGLKVVYPSNPHDAKGLLNAAFSDPNPVLFFEHKALYRSVSGEVNPSYYQVEIGKAALVKEGNEMSIITYGMGVHWALDYIKSNSRIDIEILDLRTLLPLDYEAIRETVAKTGKVLILHEDCLTGGVGAELSAWIGEFCFQLLDAPVMRCASLDTPVPFNSELEKQFLASSRLHEAIDSLSGY